MPCTKCVAMPLRKKSFGVPCGQAVCLVIDNMCVLYTGTDYLCIKEVLNPACE